MFYCQSEIKLLNRLNYLSQSMKIYQAFPVKVLTSIKTFPPCQSPTSEMQTLKKGEFVIRFPGIGRAMLESTHTHIAISACTSEEGNVFNK